MTGQIMDLVRAMGREDWDEQVLQGVCQAVETRLAARLRAGLAPEDCGGAFPVAAAWMALAALEGSDGASGVESFSAGDLTVKTGGSQRSRDLEQQAWKLMAPYCREEGFAFLGVRG